MKLDRVFLANWLKAHISTSWVYKRNVAAAYALGEGVSKNEARARAWYGHAARAGDMSATYDLGLMLMFGEGGPPEPECGRLMVQEAADAGDGGAQTFLAASYATGTNGYPKDAQRAALWAAAAGLDWSDPDRP